MLCLVFLFFHFIGFSQNIQENNICITEKPSWVKEYLFPEITKYDNDLPIIHYENQYNSVTKEHYRKMFYYVNNVKGKKDFKSFYFNYDPEYESVFLNSYKIYREGKEIELTDKTKTNQLIKEEIVSGKEYDLEGGITIINEKVKTGDLIEISYTVKGYQPDKHGFFSFKQDLYLDDLRGKSYSLIIENEKEEIKHKVLNSEIEVKKYKKNGWNYHEYNFLQNKSTIFYNQVLWHSVIPKIYFYADKQWKDIVEINLKNHKLEIPPSEKVINKVQKLTKNSKTLEEKILNILDFTQKRIEYLDYGLIEPKKTDVTLDLEYGDCKSKSLLTIKMLEVLGVKAWPIIVNSKGFDERFIDTPTFSTFNHEVIEYVYEKDTLIFDSTTFPQYGTLKDRQEHHFRYGLRTIPGTNKMTKLDIVNDNEISIEITYKTLKELDSIPDRYDFVHMNFILGISSKIKGNIVNQFEHINHNNGKKNFFSNYYCNNFIEHYQNIFKYNFSDFESSFLFHEKEREINTSFVYNNFEAESTTLNRINLDYKKGGSALVHPFQFLNIRKKDEIGVYFNLSKFKKQEVLIKLKRPVWVNKFKEDSLTINTDWMDYKMKTWEKNDTIYSLVSTNFLKLTLDSTRYDEVKEIQEQILKSNNLLLFKEKSKIERKGFWKYYGGKIIAWSILISIIGLFILPIILYIKTRKKIKRLNS